MKVAVVNFSGNVGKTTVARHLLAPRINGAKLIAVESVNADEGHRVESLTTTMNQAREATTEAAWTLSARVEGSKQQIAAIVERSKVIAVNHVFRRTNEMAAVSLCEQKQALAESARAIFGTEVSPPLRQLAATLKGLVDRANQPWEAWLTHAATA